MMTSATTPLCEPAADDARASSSRSPEISHRPAPAERGTRGGRFRRLFLKRDRPRRIDRYIDYFGGERPARHHRQLDKISPHREPPARHDSTHEPRDRRAARGGLLSAP